MFLVHIPKPFDLLAAGDAVTLSASITAMGSRTENCRSETQNAPDRLPARLRPSSRDAFYIHAGKTDSEVELVEVIIRVCCSSRPECGGNALMSLPAGGITPLASDGGGRRRGIAYGLWELAISHVPLRPCRSSPWRSCTGRGASGGGG